MISVSLVSRATARSLHGVNRHLASGHEISRLQHGLQLIMACYTRIINCRPCCNLYINVYVCVGEEGACVPALKLNERCGRRGSARSVAEVK